MTTPDGLTMFIAAVAIGWLAGHVALALSDGAA